MPGQTGLGRAFQNHGYFHSSVDVVRAVVATGDWQPNIVSLR